MSNKKKSDIKFSKEGFSDEVQGEGSSWQKKAYHVRVEEESNKQ
jgi:hypothetical protein